MRRKGQTMVKANQQIREIMKSNSVLMWWVADRLGISENSFCRWMRHELPEDVRAKVLKAIDEIIAEREAG